MVDPFVRMAPKPASEPTPHIPSLADLKEPEKNYGVDISTLIRAIEKGEPRPRFNHGNRTNHKINGVIHCANSKRTMSAARVTSPGNSLDMDQRRFAQCSVSQSKIEKIATRRPFAGIAVGSDVVVMLGKKVVASVTLVVGLVVAMLARPDSVVAQVTLQHNSASHLQGLFGRSWCGDYHLRNLTSRQRLQGKNLVRLQAVEARLAPGLKPDNTNELHLLSNYQEELEKRQPDPVLAGTYLGLASSLPITPPLYRDVNKLLCVSTTRALGSAIRAAAEAARRPANAASITNGKTHQ